MIEVIRTYRDIRDFDIIHLKGSNIISIFIKFFQQLRWGKKASSYSHSAFFLWHGSELYVYEADPEVKKTRYVDWCIGKEISISRIPKRMWDVHGGFPGESKAIVKSKLGTRYDYISLLLLQMIYIFTGKWIGTKNSNSFYCSEYVSWMIYVSFGIIPEWYTMNPAKLYNYTEHWLMYKGKARDLIDYSYSCKIKKK